MKNLTLVIVILAIALATLQPIAAQTDLAEAHALKYRKSANQSLPNGVKVPIIWDVSVYDTDGFASLPTHLITIPPNLSKGVYEFDLILEFSKTNAGNAAILIEVYNDDFVNQNFVFTLRDYSQTWAVGFAIRSSAGQTISVVVTQRGGTNVKIVGSGIIQNSQVNLTWIGTIE